MREGSSNIFIAIHFIMKFYYLNFDECHIAIIKYLINSVYNTSESIDLKY